MRLLYTASDGKLRWTEDLIGGNIPPYAILSHTWTEGQEVTFNDLKIHDNTTEVKSKVKEGYKKIFFCAQQARRDGLDYFWVDTCCIDKSNNTELSEAINSMFRWYQNAVKCYVYLSDFEHDILDEDGESAFKESRWFTRGWTLQELLAPKSVEFFSKTGSRLGDKESLSHIIHDITEIPINALLGTRLSEFSTAERFSWTENRHTTREEDGAYCLLGMFNICLPLIYGEGKDMALKRLHEHIKEYAEDISVTSVANNNESHRETQQERFSKVCRWFAAPDPSTNYHEAYKQRQDNTGLWFLESHKYKKWKSDTASKLWLYGIPGCGKTILSSTVIGNLLQHCSDDPSMVTVYFYFDFNDVRKQDPELMVRSLLCQLLQRLVTTHGSIDALLSSCENGPPPPLHTLLEMTQQAMQEFTHIYFILDALDECTQRLELLDVLETVAGWQLENLHLLMTSRKEREIESFLEGYVNHVIPLQSDIVDEDIQRYVQQRLSDDKSLMKWAKDADIKEEIEAALMRGARGMYF
jgi:hypothetical protein